MVPITPTFFEDYCEHNDFKLDTLSYIIQNGDVFDFGSKIFVFDK